MEALEILKKVKQELLQQEDYFDSLEYDGWIKYCDALASVSDLIIYVSEVTTK